MTSRYRSSARVLLRGWSADVVAPQGLVVRLEARHTAVASAVGGDERCGELVLEHPVAYLDDRAVVVGRSRLELLAFDRGLDVVKRVLGVQIGGLGHRGVDVAGRDVLQLLGDAVV